MRKQILIVLLLFGSTLTLLAQQAPFFSHYMLNPVTFNPGFVGMSDVAYLSAGHRSQWLGYSSTFDGSGGAPTTQNVVLSLPVQSIISGVGMSVINDRVGPVSNLRIQPTATISRPLGNGKINFGVAPAFISQTLRFNELRFVDESDPFNNGSQQSQAQVELDVGFVYSEDLFTVSLAVQNLLESGFDYGISDLNNSLSRTINGSFSYRYDEIYNVVFRPSILVRTDLLTTTFDVSVLADYGDKLWGGLSYRFSESIIALIGYKLLEDNKLSVGYSFDYVVSDQDAKQPTSHEIFMKYDLPSLSLGGRKIIRTPRFIF